MSGPELPVNLNGDVLPAAEARVSLFDHGLLYGDGLFETIRLEEGRFFRLEAHLLRLEAGAAQLDLALPWSRERLARAIRETARAAGVAHAAVRLTVTRGAGPPVPDPGACPVPSYFITLRAVPPPGEDAFERGVRACVTGPHPRTFVPGVKMLSYLPFQQARQAARRRGCDEGLLTDGEHVVEAAASNLFLAREGEVVTPGLESGCLPGITRAALLETAREAGLSCRETPLPQSCLVEGGELLLTNSIQGLVPVLALEGRPVRDGRPGPLARRLRAALREKVRSELRE